MGWAHGIARDGREIGYAVAATCDHPGCSAKINRGLGYVCGTMHEDEHFGCGKYFCDDHLVHYDHQDGPSCTICEECEKWHEEHRTDGGEEQAWIDATH